MFPLSLLCLRAGALEPLYSLLSPFNRTNLSEIGNWSLRGSAVSWKNAIRLTSEALKTEWGALCQRAPTAFVDWSIEIDLSARGTGSGGTGFRFAYSDTLCPRHLDNFNGFQVAINTSETDDSGLSPIFFSEGGSVPTKSSAKIKLRNQKDPLRVRITRVRGHLIVEYTTFMRFETAFKVKLGRGLPDFGYFTVSAETDFELSDNHDIYSIRTSAHSEVKTDHISEKILVNNRKILESDALKRRQAKQARRVARLPTTHHYLSVMAVNDNRLGIAGEPNLEDAFELVIEATKRGMEAVTIDMVKVFINRYLQDTLAKAGRKVNIAMDKFDDTRGDMTEMWGYLRGQLVELATETRAALTLIAAEAVETAQRVKFQGRKIEAVPSIITSTSTGMRTSADWLGRALVAVMAVELVAYLIFFARQHAKTHGFKKVD
jgi:hypothetical protein